MLNKLYAEYLETGIPDLLLEDVRKLALKVIKDEDEVQNFLLELWQILPTLSGIANFGGWVYFRMIWRRTDFFNKPREYQIFSQIEDSSETVEDRASNIAYCAELAKGSSPEFDLGRIDNARVRSIAFLLSEGYTQSEAAETLGLAEDSIRKILYRYRQSMSTKS